MNGRDNVQYDEIRTRNYSSIVSGQNGVLLVRFSSLRKLLRSRSCLHVHNSEKPDDGMEDGCLLSQQCWGLMLGGRAIFSALLNWERHIGRSVISVRKKGIITIIPKITNFLLRYFETRFGPPSVFICRRCNSFA